MIVSMINLRSNGTEQMSAAVPITNKILKILLPTIFPMAIPAFPFLYLMVIEQKMSDLD